MTHHIIHSKNLFSGIKTARYNVAAWQDASSGGLFMLMREVEQAARNIKTPDFGRLVLSEFDEAGKVVREHVVWEPAGDSLWLEDPRALALDDGSVIIGLTALLRDKRGYQPYPALTRLSSRAWREDVLPAITVVERFGPGKNITPIDSHTFFCRPEQKGYSHTLLTFSFYNLVPRKIQDLSFPTDLPWAHWRIGTALPPIWLDDNRALMIFHGIARQSGRYIYSLGKARLERVKGVFTLKVSPEPILTPDDFVDKRGRSLAPQLHPRLRRVVYACGGVVKQGQTDTLSLYVNVGDTSTFEVNLSLPELTRDLF